MADKQEEKAEALPVEISEMDREQPADMVNTRAPKQIERLARVAEAEEEMNTAMVEAEEVQVTDIAARADPAVPHA